MRKLTKPQPVEWDDYFALSGPERAMSNAHQLARDMEYTLRRIEVSLIMGDWLHEDDLLLPLPPQQRGRYNFGWQTLRVDDEAPMVDRLWREWPFESIETSVGTEGRGPAAKWSCRLYLHRITPNADTGGAESLWHPHRWPSCMRVWTPTHTTGPYYGKKGVYVHRRGYGPTWESATYGAEANQAGVVTHGEIYAMTDPEESHSVKVIGAPIYSMMIVGPFYETIYAPPEDDDGDGAPQTETEIKIPTQERAKRKPLGPVPDADAREILRVFRSLYGRSGSTLEV